MDDWILEIAFHYPHDSDWILEIAFHYPHDRFLVGWEMIEPDEQYNYFTFKLYLFIATLTLDVTPKQ